MVSALLILIFSDATFATTQLTNQGALPGVTQTIDFQPLDLQPRERIEFGFVLLPDASTIQDVQGLANDVSSAVKGLTSSRLKPNEDGYANKIVKLPHVSLGQYGFLAKEFPALKEIVNQIATKFSPFKEPISESLVTTDENVFLDFQHIKGETNPKIIELYKKLRHEYMTHVTTKFPIAQALMERLVH